MSLRVKYRKALMRILLGETWVDGHVPYHRGVGELRLAPVRWCCLAPVEGLYFVRAGFSLRQVLAYVQELGLGPVLDKIRSRRSEAGRNDKYLSCGIARVVEADDPERWPGLVWFVAPAHPAACDELVLPEALVGTWDGVLSPEAESSSIDWADLRGLVDASHFSEVAGWRPGVGLAAPSSDTLSSLVESAVDAAGSAPRRHLARGTRQAGHAVGLAPAPVPSPSSAVLIGWGNYAKTVILPSVKAHLRVERVHEMDPLQIPRRRAANVIWDTSPVPPDGVRHRAWLIAGYHHTHAPLASEAMIRGSYAVVEKPLATDHAQLETVIAVARRTRRLFTCFQRRYSVVNDWLREDLASAPESPLSFHCIVFEVPLPLRHWYRWPVSGSRVLSNGCHWIDHFLFLNPGCKPVDWDVRVSRDHTASVWVELENGATFSMTLTDRGSSRLGVQDHVEVRSADRTACIVNGRSYRAEDGSRILRRAHTSRMDSYRRMYGEISRRIALGLDGGDPDADELSARLTLDLDQAFWNALPPAPAR